MDKEATNRIIQSVLIAVAAALIDTFVSTYTIGIRLEERLNAHLSETPSAQEMNHAISLLQIQLGILEARTLVLEKDFEILKINYPTPNPQNVPHK